MYSKYVNDENLKLFAYTNEKEVIKPIRGIVLVFHGLGHNSMKTTSDNFDNSCSEKGILSVFPYYGAWSWMNFQAVNLVDNIISVLIQKHNLSENIPIVSTGGSMGGLSALIYTRYAKTTPVACAANCPVCDLPFHSTERDDLPRTMYSAFGHYDCGVDIAMTLHSPIHQVCNMPQIPYYIVHGDADTAVSKKYHSDKFVAAMRGNQHSITYNEVTGMAHCDFSKHAEVEKDYYNFIFSFADKE